MTQKFSIAAGDHRAGIAQERFDGMAGRGCLPFVAVEVIYVQESLSDFLLRGAGPVSIEGLQHPSKTCALLPGQSGVGRDSAAMQCREEATNRLNSVEAFETERNDGHGHRIAIHSTVDDLEILPVAERETEITGGAVRRDVDTPCGGDMTEAVFEC